MLKRTRRRSAQISLVLMGAAALAACENQDERRDLYASKQDCVKDWGDETRCEAGPDGAAAAGRSHTGGGYFWGPYYAGSSLRSGSAVGSASRPVRSGSRAIGSSNISRGGFGSSSASRSSSGS